MGGVDAGGIGEAVARVAEAVVGDAAAVEAEQGGSPIHGKAVAADCGVDQPQGIQSVAVGVGVVGKGADAVVGDLGIDHPKGARRGGCMDAAEGGLNGVIGDRQAAVGEAVVAVGAISKLVGEDDAASIAGIGVGDRDVVAADSQIGDRGIAARGGVGGAFASDDAIALTIGDGVGGLKSDDAVVADRRVLTQANRWIGEHAHTISCKCIQPDFKTIDGDIVRRDGDNHRAAVAAAKDDRFATTACGVGGDVARLNPEKGQGFIDRDVACIGAGAHQDGVATGGRRDRSLNGGVRLA